MAKSKLPFNTPYLPNATEPSAGIDTGESLTEQSHAATCDINKIVASSMENGIFPEAPEPRFADTTGNDFQETMDTIAKTTQSFEQLPAETRAFFNNDIPAFLDFIRDPKNAEQMIELDLIAPDSKFVKIGSSKQPKTEQPEPSAPKADKDGDDDKKEPKKGS